jgi:hypothetical protein
MQASVKWTVDSSMVHSFIRLRNIIVIMLPVNKATHIQKSEHLVAPFFMDVTIDTPLEQISCLLDNEERQLLTYTPWEAYTYKPVTHYSVSYGDDSLFLKFYVEEKYVTAGYGNANDPVYMDSCVEFFISFDGQGYYNFEFNCIGTCLAEFGQGKDDRHFLPEQYIEKVRSQSVIYRNCKENVVCWTLTLAIPLCVLHFHSLSYLKGRECKVNFFKCGNGLPEPHFVAWKNIEASEPNFHLPQFFDTMTFR